MQGFGGEGIVCVRGERQVFAGLDFRVGLGEALLLTGPNGSGKSSLLRIMAGLLKPAAGRVLWGGADVREDPEAHRARIAYVGHADAVKPVLTVRENLAFWAQLFDREGTTADERVHAALEHYGLAHLGDVPGRFLSSGQRRRLGLARTLAAPAPLWLLDEPTVGLDEAARAALDEALAGHRAEGGMVVAATHIAMLAEDAAGLDLAAAGAAEQVHAA